jgi:hypothetical protein
MMQIKFYGGKGYVTLLGKLNIYNMKNFRKERL